MLGIRVYYIDFMTFLLGFNTITVDLKHKPWQIASACTEKGRALNCYQLCNVHCDSAKINKKYTQSHSQCHTDRQTQCHTDRETE